MPPPRRVGDRFPTPCKRTSWRPMQAAGPDKSLNVGLPGCTAMPLPSSPILPHASFARGTQAPHTMSSGLRLGLNGGGLIKYSGGLRHQQTTRKRRQASRSDQPCPATWRLPRPSDTALLQCVLTDSDARRDVPVTKHCNSYFLSPCAPPLASIKGRGGQPLQGLDLLQIERKTNGSDTLSRPVCNS
jgi:hypothetical protein